MKRKRQEDDFESLMAETLGEATQKERADFIASMLAPRSASVSSSTGRKERKEKRKEQTEKKVGPTYFQGKFVGMEILQPQIEDDHFVWTQVAVGPSPGRKFGLFATKDLPAYTLLPYFGLAIASNAYNQKFLKLVEDHDYDEYMLESKGTIIDGSPALYPYPSQLDAKQPQIGMLGLSIAAFSNEPFQTERANSTLIGDHTIPLLLPAILTLKPINAGEEILTCYNRKRDYKSSCPASVQVPKRLGEVLKKESANIEQWNDKYREIYYQFPERITI